MDRYWLLTSNTYGSWLPGDSRGFVGFVRDKSGRQVIHNIPGTPVEPANSGLNRYASTQLKSPPTRFDLGQAELLADQFHETVRIRQWELLAVAIMANHVHWVVGVLGDPDPENILRDLKSYGSRKLNRHFGPAKPAEWWAESGSKRKLSTQQNVLAAVLYVINQEYPLVIWTAPIPELDLPGGRIV
jgi:REP element-mobilizing transposase RayT